MKSNTQTLAATAVTVLPVYFLLTDPVQAAQSVRTFMGQLATGADNVLLFLQHLGT